MGHYTIDYTITGGSGRQRCNRRSSSGSSQPAADLLIRAINAQNSHPGELDLDASMRTRCSDADDFTCALIKIELLPKKFTLHGELLIVHLPRSKPITSEVGGLDINIYSKKSKADLAFHCRRYYSTLR